MRMLAAEYGADIVYTEEMIDKRCVGKAASACMAALTTHLLTALPHVHLALAQAHRVHARGEPSARHNGLPGPERQRAWSRQRRFGCVALRGHSAAALTAMDAAAASSARSWCSAPRRWSATAWWRSWAPHPQARGCTTPEAGSTSAPSHPFLTCAACVSRFEHARQTLRSPLRRWWRPALPPWTSTWAAPCTSPPAAAWAPRCCASPMLSQTSSPRSCATCPAQ
jgi:hypothetical protein